MNTISDDDPFARPPSLLQYPSYLLAQVTKVAHRHLVDGLATHRLRLPHFGVLCAVRDFGPETQRAIGDRLDIDKSRMVGLVDQLEKRGFVLRERDPKDRRCHLIALTEEGRNLLPKLHAIAEERRAEIFASLTEKERSELERVLRRVIAAHDGERREASRTGDRLS